MANLSVLLLETTITTVPEIMAEAAGNEKPAVLIIGGMGYVGRFLALHIHKNNLASEVRLVDKVLPQLAWLAPEFAEACSQDKFIQADASKERESNFPLKMLPGQLRHRCLTANNVGLSLYR